MAFYGLYVIETVLDDEERGTRRKEQRGGRSSEEEGMTGIEMPHYSSVEVKKNEKN